MLDVCVSDCVCMFVCICIYCESCIQSLSFISMTISMSVSVSVCSWQCGLDCQESRTTGTSRLTWWLAGLLACLLLYSATSVLVSTPELMCCQDICSSFPLQAGAAVVVKKQRLASKRYASCIFCLYLMLLYTCGLCLYDTDIKYCSVVSFFVLFHVFWCVVCALF